jgi:ribosomal protein L19E
MPVSRDEAWQLPSEFHSCWDARGSYNQTKKDDSNNTVGRRSGVKAARTGQTAAPLTKGFFDDVLNVIEGI